jgi:hypothetical protein
MSIRSLVRNLLIADTDLLALIPADRWIQATAADDSPPARPFAVLRFAGTFPMQVRAASQCALEIWIHDNAGSYDRIDEIVKKVKATMASSDQATEDSYNTDLIHAEWSGDSVDLFDDGYRTNTKSTSFNLTGMGF